MMSLIRKLMIAARTRMTPDPLETLRQRGLKAGHHFAMMTGVVIDPSHCWHISIGDHVTLAPFVHILAHDASTKMHLGYTRIGKVSLGSHVFVGASSIIMPGVTIGDRVIIGAGSVVTRDIESGWVAAGNPAKPICTTEAFLAKRSEEMKSVPLFGAEYTLGGGVTPAMMDAMNARMEARIGYII